MKECLYPISSSSSYSSLAKPVAVKAQHGGSLTIDKTNHATENQTELNAELVISTSSGRTTLSSVATTASASTPFSMISNDSDDSSQEDDEEMEDYFINEDMIVDSGTHRQSHSFMRMFRTLSVSSSSSNIVTNKKRNHQNVEEGDIEEEISKEARSGSTDANKSSVEMVNDNHNQVDFSGINYDNCDDQEL